MTTEKTLADLKVGDKVGMSSGYGRTMSIYSITGETPTCWKVRINERCERMFNKQTLRERGGDSRVYLLSDEDILRINRENKQTQLAYNLRDFDFRKLPLETLEAINALLPKEEGK